MRPLCPCKGCSDRELHCHGQCGKYKEWKAKIAEEYVVRQKENDKYPKRKIEHKFIKARYGIK